MRNVKLSIILTISILYGVVARAVSQSLDPTTPYYQKIVSQGFNPATVTDLSAEKTIVLTSTLPM